MPLRWSAALSPRLQQQFLLIAFGIALGTIVVASGGWGSAQRHRLWAEAKWRTCPGEDYSTHSAHSQRSRRNSYPVPMQFLHGLQGRLCSGLVPAWIRPGEKVHGFHPSPSSSCPSSALPCGQLAPAIRLRELTVVRLSHSLSISLLECLAPAGPQHGMAEAVPGFRAASLCV